MPVTSRSVVFDELRASEKAKHIDAARRLSRGYDVIQPAAEIKLEEKEVQMQTPMDTKIPNEEAGEKHSQRELVRSAKSTQPKIKIKNLAKMKQPRRSRRLNFAKIAELVFDDESDGEMETIQMGDEGYALMGDVEMSTTPKSNTQAYQSPEAPNWK